MLNATRFGTSSKKRDSLWARILGMHRVNGLVSREEVQSDSRGYRIGDFDPDSKRLFAPRGVIEGAEGVTSGFRYYLSDDLRGQAGAAGSGIGNISEQVFNPEGGQVNVRYFDNTWKAGTAVNPGDPWTSPFGNESFQAENPANYQGWTERQANFVTIFSDDVVNGMTSKDYLTSSGSLNDFEVNSVVGVWQAYLWDKSIIGTYGYREDRFRRYSYTSSERQGTGRVDTGGADLGSATYNFENPDGTIESMRTITRNWSVAVHLNRLLGKRDFLPVNVSVYYNRGENFQPSEGSRIDAFGKPLPPPHGETEERSVLIATKDNKYSLRATKYETSVVDASSTGSVGNMWALEQVSDTPLAMRAAGVRTRPVAKRSARMTLKQSSTVTVACKITSTARSKRGSISKKSSLANTPISFRLGSREIQISLTTAPKETAFPKARAPASPLA